MFRQSGQAACGVQSLSVLEQIEISRYVVYDGFDNFAEGVRRGKGVIFLTGHFGALELSSFAHSIYGHPMKFVVREIDNPRVERLIAGYRCRGGNAPVYKKNASRDILESAAQYRNGGNT